MNRKDNCICGCNNSIMPINDSRLWKSKVKTVMSKERAMSLLGLSIMSEGKKKKPKQASDYSEDDLLKAFRETCSMIGV